MTALTNMTKARRLSTGGALVASTIALGCTAMLGTAQAASAAPVTSLPGTQAQSSTSASSYTVRQGDSLSSIARAFHITGGFQALATANHLTSASVLRPGKILTLPVAPSSSAVPLNSQGYTNNLDGWIKQSLAIMHAKKIPGSYNGIYRNIMRESSGNPKAINLWDSNAKKGIPSKGLLQVIDPTFRTYHVEGTSWDIYDPVANITAACNYAYHRYGSMDNVNSAY